MSQDLYMPHHRFMCLARTTDTTTIMGITTTIMSAHTMVEATTGSTITSIIMVVMDIIKAATNLTAVVATATMAMTNAEASSA